FGSSVPEENRSREVADHNGFCGEVEQLGALAQRGDAFLQFRIQFAEFFATLCNALFELTVKGLQLAGFAIKLDEDADLGAQDFGDDGNGDVVNGATLVGADAVDIREMHGGDEDNRRLLKTWVLAYHVGQLKAIDLWHGDIHEDDSNIGLEEVVEGFTTGCGLDETLVEISEDNFVADELGGLIVNHEDGDRLAGTRVRQTGGKRRQRT